MKIAAIVVSTLIGLLLLWSSIAYFFKIPMELPEMGEDMKTFNAGLGASDYMMPLVKALELLCGLAFVSGRFVTLANIVILPITINILLTNFFMAPENVLIAALLFTGNLFLIYMYCSNYKSLFAVQ